MKKAFTLLELMIVMIIVGVLATVGLVQYQSAIERSRGVEAKNVIGGLRKLCAGVYVRDGNTSTCNDTTLMIGSGPGFVPGPTASACNSTHYFWYSYSTVDPDGIVFTANRCTGGAGKSPTGSRDGSVTLTTDYKAGSDQWSGDY